MYKGKRVAPSFYAFNRHTGEIYSPRTIQEQRYEMRRFFRWLWLDFKIDRKIPFGWKLFRSERAMEDYVHAFCYGK